MNKENKKNNVRGHSFFPFYFNGLWSIKSKRLFRTIWPGLKCVVASLCISNTFPSEYYFHLPFFVMNKISMVSLRELKSFFLEYSTACPSQPSWSHSFNKFYKSQFRNHVLWSPSKLRIFFYEFPNIFNSWLGTHNYGEVITL